MARPKSPKYEIDFILDTMEDYIESTELPIFKDVCVKNNWCSDYIYQLSVNNEELSRCIKKLSDKKEVELERGGLTGKYNKTMAVFSLKQLGWKDKIELEQTNSNDNAIKIEMVAPSEEDVERIKRIKEQLFKNDKN